MSTPTPPPPTPQAASAAPLPAEPEQPRLSEPARLIGTFIAPSKTFLDIRRNASWWAPLVLISVFSVSFFVMIDKKVGFEQIARKVLEKNRQVQQQTPEQQERAVPFTVAILKFTGYASPIFILLYALIITLVLWGTFNFGMAAEIPFGRALAIVMYGWLPSLVGTALGMITLAIGNPEGFKLENPVGTNPAYFLDPETTSKFVYSALTAFDVISLWTVVLIGLGFALNAGKKVKTGTAIGTVAGWFFVWKLISAAFALLRG
jgi:hypothetical protein